MHWQHVQFLCFCWKKCKSFGVFLASAGEKKTPEEYFKGDIILSKKPCDHLNISKWNSILEEIQQIMIVGIIGLLKAFILLKSKASDKLIAWSANQPLILYRVGGVAYIAVGVALIKFL